MNCLGVDRAKQMVDAIVRMEKAAVLAPALASFMEDLVKEAHRQHVQCPEWRDCKMAICAHAKALLKLAEEIS